MAIHSVVILQRLHPPPGCATLQLLTGPVGVVPLPPMNSQVLSLSKRSEQLGGQELMFQTALSASNVVASPFRLPKGLVGADQSVITARQSRLM